MTRRQTSSSRRQSKRTTTRQLPLNRPTGTKEKRSEAQETETAENADAEDITEDAVARSTGPNADLIEIDDESSTLGPRQRSEKASTPQRGQNKKKARVDLTGDSSSAESEEEIIFDHNSSSSSSSPPTPRRLCHEDIDGKQASHEAQSSNDDSSLDSPEVEEPPPAPTRTMATVVTETLRPMQPEAHNILKSCRYAAQLTVPPHATPVKKAGELLQDVLKEIQKQAGTQVWLAAWQAGEDTLTCKKPKDIPTGTASTDRDIFTRLFDNYMSLTPDTEKQIYLKIHFVTQSPDALKIPLKEIGLKVEALQDRFGFRLNPNPNPCQSPKVTTIGWCFGSVKAMDSDKLIQGLRDVLKIPKHVNIGAQWRTIADKNGKRYPWPKDKNSPRPPQAIHIDIDDAHVGPWYPKVAKLWKKGGSRKVNHLLLRIVPCFTTQVGRSLTPVRHANTVYMAQKQAHFVNMYSTRLTTPNILELDLPVGPDKMTLRRHLMKKAPEGKITERIFISVDPTYCSNDYTLTTPKKYADQALQIMNNMIPECLHEYGEHAARWFTNMGLIAYQDVKWDKTLNAPTSIHDEAATELLDEDFYGMGEEWRVLPTMPDPPPLPHNLKA